MDVARRWLLTRVPLAMLVAPSVANAAAAKVVFVAFQHLPAYEASFDAKLRELGWNEGRNLLVERRYLEPGAVLPEIAAEVVRRAPDVIVVPSAGIAAAVKLETARVPIVVLAAGDLVSTGLAESLARPGGNVTGTQIVQRDLIGKQLQLLRDALPRLMRVAALQETVTVPPTMRADTRRVFEPAARALQIEPLWYEVQGVGALEDRFRSMAGRQVHAVIVVGSPFMLQNARLLAEIAAKYRIPATYASKDFVQAGGLMSYGVDFLDVFARGAVFVDKILKGSKPADLPIEQPTKLELVINLKTAKALGLTIPPSLLLRADQVIE